MQMEASLSSVKIIDETISSAQSSITGLKKQLLDLEAQRAIALGRQFAQQKPNVLRKVKPQHVIGISCELCGAPDGYENSEELSKPMKLTRFYKILISFIPKEERDHRIIRKEFDNAQEGDIIDIYGERGIGYYYIWRNSSKQLMVARTLGEYGNFLPCYALPFIVTFGITTSQKVSEDWPAIRGIVVSATDDVSHYRDFGPSDLEEHYPYYVPGN